MNENLISFLIPASLLAELLGGAALLGAELPTLLKESKQPDGTAFAINELKTALHNGPNVHVTLENDITIENTSVLPIKVQGNYTLDLNDYTITAELDSDKAILFKLQDESHLTIQNTLPQSLPSLFMSKGIGIRILNSSHHSITMRHVILNSGSYGVNFEYGKENTLTLIDSTIYANKIGIYSAGGVDATMPHHIDLKGNSKVRSTDYDSVYLSGCTHLSLTESASINSTHADGIYTYWSQNEIYLSDNTSVTGSNGILIDYPDNKLTISGTSTITGTDGVGLLIHCNSQKGHITLSGGTFSGTDAAIEIKATCNLTLDALLAEGYDYYDTQTGEKLNLEGKTSIKGIVTVKLSH